MLRLFLVCAGGALGSGARYLMVNSAVRLFGNLFPWGTMTVNLLGSFLLAVVMTVALAGRMSEEFRLFLSAGVMGGFTTYSSFNWETVTMFEGGRPWLAVANSALTFSGCLALAVAGSFLVRKILA